MRITKDTLVCELIHSEEELLHYGVPGMKWGVIRDRDEDGTPAPKGKKRRDESDGYEFDKHGYKVPVGRPHKSLLPDLDAGLNSLMNSWTDRGRDYVRDMPLLSSNYSDIADLDLDSIPLTMPTLDSWDYENR